MNEKSIQRSGCLILCGGKSRRMKRDKAKLVYHDKTFLEIICEQVRRTGMPGYISLADGEGNIPAGFKVIRDEARDENGGSVGPLGGIYTGLRQCVRDGLEGIYTVPVDLPLFQRDLFDVIDKAIQAQPQADIYILESSDGRMHPAAGYYRRRVIGAAEDLIDAHDYRLMSLIRHPDVRMVSVRTENAEQDRMLFNVNTPGDYEALVKKAGYRPKHIVLQGEKGAGKSTLIKKLVREMHCATGGYLTRAVMDPEKGYREIYMYPAASLFETADPDAAARTYGKLCGIAMNGVKEVYPEVFDTYGTQLIHFASKKELIVMDEIGFMEEKAEQFKKAVLSAFDGNIPVIASIKTKHITSPFLEAVRNHENVYLAEVDEADRDEVFEQIKKLYTDQEEGLQ